MRLNATFRETLPLTLPPRRPTLRDRLFQTFWRFSRSATLGVRAVVTDAEGRVLLIRHTYTPGWHFPGGGVEKGETAQLAAVRELREEAGIVAEAPPELISVHANHAFFPNDHVLVFRVAKWRQDQATSRGEVAEVKFFDPGAPPGDVSKGTARRLKEIFGGEPLSEAW